MGQALNQGVELFFFFFFKCVCVFDKANGSVTQNKCYIVKQRGRMTGISFPERGSSHRRLSSGRSSIPLLSGETFPESAVPGPHTQPFNFHGTSDGLIR